MSFNTLRNVFFWSKPQTFSITLLILNKFFRLSPGVFFISLPIYNLPKHSCQYIVNPHFAYWFKDVFCVLTVDKQLRTRMLGLAGVSNRHLLCRDHVDNSNDNIIRNWYLDGVWKGKLGYTSPIEHKHIGIAILIEFLEMLVLTII